VRPAKYREISNFYTLTIYEKGAEIVRVLHTLLGEATFRAGMDRYFADNDGRGATIEDFLAAHAAASGRDLSGFLAWYAQAGTPELRIDEAFNAATGDYVLTVRQHTPPVPGHRAPVPLPMPLRVALYDADGARIAAAPDTDARPGDGHVELSAATHVLRWRGLAGKPLASFNHGFAAPVKLVFDHSPDDLARLARLERDPYNRWDLLQRLATAALLKTMDEAAAVSALSDALADLLDDAGADPAFVAECLALPDVDTLAEQVDRIDVDALFAAREELLDRLAEDHVERLRARYDALAAAADGGADEAAMAARALRGACLQWLTRLDPDAALAEAQFAAARTMTERLAALRALVHFDAPGASAAVAAFRERHAADPLVTDKWIAIVASRPHPDTLADVEALLATPWWKATNPNRVRALVGSFARGNPLGFHRRDGAGYRFVAGQVDALDKLNPQVAARLLGGFESWRRLVEPQRALARAALASLEGRLASSDGRDLLQRLLAD
jgi:aminopeptidase N